MIGTQPLKIFRHPLGRFALVVAFLLSTLPVLDSVQAVGPSVQSTPSSGKKDWWEHDDPGSHYVRDKQGRNMLSVCRIDGSHPGRPKGDIRRLERPGMKPGDHRGHGCPENLVDNPDRVNTQLNTTAQSPDVNLSSKRKVEERAKKIKEENPNSKIYFVVEYLYKGEEERPVAETVSIMNYDNGEILYSVTLFNNNKDERHTIPDQGGTAYFREQREKVEAEDMGALDKVLSGNDKPAPSDKAAKSAPGGIDFSTLELRYIAEDSSPFADRGLKYAFNATPASSNKNLNAGRIAAAQASDAFFVWLSLSPDKFWVNLNPNEPNRIIDTQFGKTDAGRILLQADLRMKKTVARLIHPDTSLGKQFWQELDWKDSKACVSFRQWIVPAPATIREDGNGIYITDAPLNVKLESQYLQSKGISGFLASCSTVDKSTLARNESVFRRLILPRVEQAVNKSPEYADLRRVYRSRVAAEWYRQRSASKETTYREMVNHNDISSWPARQDWSPRQVFNQYVNSYEKGEFHVVHSHKWQEGNMIYTQKKFYIYGGVDFTKVLFNKLNSTDFQGKWGDLRQVVDTSMKSPVADQRGKIWLGGSTITGRAIWKTIWFYLALGVLALLFLILWKRLYRRRSL